MIRRYQWFLLSLFLVGKICGLVCAVLIVGTRWHPDWRGPSAALLIAYVGLIFGCIALTLSDWRRQVRDRSIKTLSRRA